MRPKSVPPWHHTMVLPAKQSPTPWGCTLPVSGQQMDASPNMRAQSKQTSSPAPVDQNKCTKTPTREPDEPVRHSRSLHRYQGGHARSQSCPKWEEVFIPVGYESTYCQEHKREEKQHRSVTLKRHLEKQEAEKQEVLMHSCSYISRHAREIRSTLQPMDKAVRGFKVFGNNAAIYAAYIMATLEWGRMYHHYGGRDAVPVLPEWLTTYTGVTKSLTTNMDLPRKCVQVSHPNIQLNSMVTWQWMADLLQFWTDLSGPRLFDGIFCYPSALAEQLMTDINPSFDTPHHITWQRIMNNTPSWLNARALFDRSQQAEFDRQQKRHADLNDLEQGTECLYECSLEGEAHHDERRAKAEADSVWLPLERQLARKQRQEQAKVMGIVTSSTDDSNYPLWHRQPQCKTPGPDVPWPYATPEEMSAAGCDTMINKELGSEDVYDPLQLRNASPTPGLRIPPMYSEDTATIPPICLPIGRFWRLWHWRPRQWRGLTCDQA